MRIIIKPQNDEFIDQLWGAVAKFLQLSKEKYPKLPKMEIIMDADQQPNYCKHEFRVVDVTPGLVMVQCQLCHCVYHAVTEGVSA